MEARCLFSAQLYQYRAFWKKKHVPKEPLTNTCVRCVLLRIGWVAHQSRIGA